MSSEAKEVVKIYLNLRLFCNRASTGIFQKGQEDKGANSIPSALMRALPEPERGT
jgi:hypothetical protein